MATVKPGNPSDPRHLDGDATWHHWLVAGIVASYRDCVYVEIGVLQAGCWNVAAPLAAEAHGVDPDPQCIDYMGDAGEFWNMESDKFFKEYDGSTPDVIFVDGDHHQNQVLPDMRNSLDILSPYGTIVMHDTQPIIWPALEDYPERPDQIGPIEALSGTAWKVRVIMEKDPNLQCFTFQRYPGITIVRKR